MLKDQFKPKAYKMKRATMYCSCGKNAELVTGEILFPNSPAVRDRMYWLCACGAYIHCKSGTMAADGILADEKMRKAKAQCHSLATLICALKGKGYTKDQVWIWLGEKSERFKKFRVSYSKIQDLAWAINVLKHEVAALEKESA